MYPSLPATIEMTEEDKTQKWVNDTSKITNHANKTKTNKTLPDYDASEDSQRDDIQLNRAGESDRRSEQDVYHSAPPSYDGYQPESVAPKRHPPAEMTVNNSAPSRE